MAAGAALLAMAVASPVDFNTGVKPQETILQQRQALNAAMEDRAHLILSLLSVPNAYPPAVDVPKIQKAAEHLLSALALHGDISATDSSVIKVNAADSALSETLKPLMAAGQGKKFEGLVTQLEEAQNRIDALKNKKK